MNSFYKKIQAYCEKHTSAPSPILNELERETNLKTLAPQMLSGPLQGQLFRFISQLLQPRAILEVGTFTGYAAICLVDGLQNGGILHTFEVNPELEQLIRKYIQKAGLEEKIKLHIGDARKILPGLDEIFDLAFIDAGKHDNPPFYEIALEKLRPGGVLLVDNVLWSGKVVENARDTDTQSILNFNKMVQEDPRVENIMLPVRDGLLVVRKLKLD